MDTSKLVLGASGTAVATLHNMLRRLGVSLPVGEVDAATLGSGTQTAVRSLHERLGFVPCGDLERDLAELLGFLELILDPDPVNPPPPPPPPKSFVVGTVIGADGRPLVAAQVIVYARGLRSSDAVGKAQTNANGAYRISYPSPLPGAPGVGSGIVVTVLSATGAELASSPILFNARPLETVDILVGGGTYAGPSRYEKIVAAATPFLKDLSFADLQENANTQDITFLSRETSLPASDIAMMSVAFRLAKSTQLAPEALFGLFQQNIPSGIGPLLLTRTAGNTIDLDANGARALTSLLATKADVREQALTTALSSNDIPLYFRDSIARTGAQLVALTNTAALSQPLGTGKVPVGAVLDAGNIAKDLQSSFISIYSNHTGTMRTFWKDLARQPGFTKVQVADLRFAHDIGRFTRGHLPLIQELTSRRKAGSIKRTADLARLDAADWTEILNSTSGEQVIGPPANIDGKDAAQKTAQYANFLANSFEHAYPTVALTARLAKDPNSPVAAKSDVVTFAESNPSFSYLRTNIDRFLKDTPAALNGVQNPALLKTTVLQLQRLSKLAPTYSTLKPLLNDGLHSAQQVYSMGRDRFIKTYSAAPAIGTAKATEIYAKAEQTYARALNLVANVNNKVAGPSPSAATNPGTPSSTQPALKDFPNLQSLFGSLDLCECSDCRSVLSPAAYLVDILHFLNQRHSNGPVTPARSVKAILFDRRPDLGQIELSCPNTNIPLPYIDLVNELLEDSVAPPPDLVAAARARQTRGTAEELAANPEYVNTAAYTTLAAATFPWALPFDLPLDEARTYLAQLNTTRLDLMKTFAPPAPSGSAQAAALAHEALGLNPVEASLITGAALNPPKAAWDLWGLAASGNAIKDPTDSSRTVSGTWVQVLSHVDVLLNRAGVTFDELSQLLNTRLLNGDNALSIVMPDSNSCDVSAMTLSGLDADRLDRIRRFIRLWRKLGWSAYEVDKAVFALQGSVVDPTSRLNDALLGQLFRVTSAMSALSLPVTSALALWAPIDTADMPPPVGQTNPIPSLYTQLFQNKVVLNPVDPIFKLNPAGTDLAAAGPGLKISDHKATIVAALGISDADLLLALPTDGLLNLHNLSTLFRHFTLASALGLSIADLLSLKALTQLDPFDPAKPENLALFLTKAAEVAQSGFSVATLDYLLRHTYTESSGLAPATIVIGTLLREIRIGLQKIATENAFAPDPSGSVTKKRLSVVLKPADVDVAMGILAGTSALPDLGQKTFIAASLASFLDVPSAQAALVGGAALPAGQQRFEYVLTRLMTYLGRTLSVSFVKQHLTDATQADAAVIGALLTTYLKAQFDASKPSIEEFLRLPSIPRAGGLTDADPIDPRFEVSFQTAFDTFRLLQKSTTLFNSFNMPADEVAWLFTRGTTSLRTDPATGFTTGWLDPTLLPLAPVALAGPAFQAWERIAVFVALRSALPSGPTSLTRLFEEARTATKAVLFQDLAARTQWTLDSLTILAGDKASNADMGLLGLAFPAGFHDEYAMTRLLPAFRMIRQLGISADVAQWIGANITPAAATAIKQLVKARYSSAQWSLIAKPLRDALRIRQRDSLVAWLLANPPAAAGYFKDVNDIYSYFLIDVEMSPCQLSTRIKQAAASIQLFAQRCLLNLEKDVVADATSTGDEDWLQWKWMEFYRVWEANRQVFLYPENWIAPELRRDKSPFCKDLESELLQSDLTLDTAETAYRNYLEKLAQVARLEVVGTYHQLETAVDVLHTFARTQGHPPIYFYRQRVDSYRWTAWTKVELDIASDHIFPIVWNRRLYLFWLIFTKKPNANTSFADPRNSAVAATPGTHWEIQLSWSEFKDSKWLAKQTAPQKLITDGYYDLSRFTVKTFETGDALAVDIFWQDDQSDGFPHVAQFLLSGAGNGVEPFVVPGTVADLPGASNSAGGMSLSPVLQKPDLIAPSAADNDAMWFAPWVYGPLPADPSRRVAYFYALYSYYGTLKNQQVLAQAGSSRVLVPHQDLNFDSTLPFFFEDSRYSFFVVPSTYYKNGNYFFTTPPPYVYNPFYISEYRFYSNHHPFVPLFLRQLNAKGIPGLLQRPLQVAPMSYNSGVTPFNFKTRYQPTSIVQTPYPAEDVDFQSDGPYSIYNWELFFHVPLTIANALARNQRFDDARRWYQYIFDPTNATNESTPQRYWITRPFFEMTGANYANQNILGLMALIAKHDSASEFQVAEWRKNPFDPHVIAQLRPVAYQRNVVMKYIDNLIAWGDSLFRRDTIESINEATQLYVLAQQLLGPRPHVVPSQAINPVKTYADLEPGLDAFSNELIAAENVLPPPQVNIPSDSSVPRLPSLPTLYFCVPPNDKLARYWDTVEDRLFKIRHCMNIEGVVQQLPLYEAPIDPGLLVQAAAAGLDLSSVLSDLSSPLPHYRFTYMLGKAREFAAEVKALGSAMLQALEKRDAEALAQLRTSGEVRLVQATKGVKQRQVDEATQSIDALNKQQAVTAERRNYYRDISFTNPWEDISIALTAAALIPDIAAIVLESTAGAAHLVPGVQFGGSGFGGTPHVTGVYGGQNVGSSAGNFAKALRVASSLLHTGSQMSSTLAGYHRRADDWALQMRLAEKELTQLDAQILGAQIRQNVAQMESSNYQIDIDNATKSDDLLHSKYTQQDLYEWMIAQTAGIFFQSYQLAYDIAKQAERCFRSELGISESSFVQFGYWDSLKKGLLSGDKLELDLNRMESAYLDANARELELTRHISLLALDPVALVKLKTNGVCRIQIPEIIFDLDTPGHYMRRIRSVAVTIPCVSGPYTSVSATLNLLQNSVRMTTGLTAQPDKYERTDPNDIRFRDDPGGIDRITTSSAQNDSGMFDVNMHEERYLPFEGAGAVSQWSLELTAAYPQFDYQTISDAILHLRYSARDGGESFRALVSAHVTQKINAIALAESRQGLYRSFSARHDFPSNWQRFLFPGPAADQVFTFDTALNRFPFFTRGLLLKASSIEIAARLTDNGPYDAILTPPGGAPPINLSLTTDGTFGNLHAVLQPLAPLVTLGRLTTPPQPPVPSAWTLQVRKSGAPDFRSLQPQDIDDVAIIIKYEVHP